MYAIIGDIHGSFNTFEALIERILPYKIKCFIFVGDLVDRGKYSKEVINLAMEISKRYEVILIRGNHEDMMLDYIYSEGRYDEGVWFANGGYQTVKSFSESLYYSAYFNYENISYELKILCENELKFLNKVKLYHTLKFDNTTFFISHAGIEYENVSPFRQLDYVKDEYEKNIYHPYIWSRVVDDFKNKINDFIFIHGHTPVKEVYINKNKNDEIISINIDTGCVYGNKLTAMLLNEDGSFQFISERYKG